MCSKMASSRDPVQLAVEWKSNTGTMKSKTDIEQLSILAANDPLAGILIPFMPNQWLESAAYPRAAVAESCAGLFWLA